LAIDAASSTLEWNQGIGSDGIWYFYPAIIRDSEGNLAMVFNRSSSSEYANCRYTVKLVSDTGWQQSVSLKSGEGPYANYGDPPGPRNRWGDYSGASLDPLDTAKAWVSSEYAGTSNEWSTWIGQFQVGFRKPDFNHDGDADIIWQNNSTGQRTMWLMNGMTWNGNEAYLGVAGLDWQIMGTGDFDRDGKVDILWQNTTTGQRTIWLMNGTTWSGRESYLGVAGLQWEIRNH
jgi:hypothetical protein